MSLHTRDSSRHVNIWKRVPHRIKGLLKTNKFNATSPPPPPPLSVYTKSKPSSLIYRIFSSRNKGKALIQLKEHQWDNPTSDATELDLYSSTETPLRASLLSFFNPQHHQGWSQTLSLDKLDELSRVYMSTLQKMRILSHYSMEQQISLHHMLSYIQYSTAQMQQQQQQQQQQQRKPLMVRNGSNGVYQRDFNSLLAGRAMTDSILTNNRKPRRTRYIFMLLSTPASHVSNKLHPVTDALTKLRKPYAETLEVINASDLIQSPLPPPKAPVEVAKSAHKFVPADYLLDPATLFCSTNHHNRLGTKFGGGTATESSEHHDLINTTSQIMAKIQIQTN